MTTKDIPMRVVLYTPKVARPSPGAISGPKCKIHAALPRNIQCTDPIFHMNPYAPSARPDALYLLLLRMQLITSSGSLAHRTADATQPTIARRSAGSQTGPFLVVQYRR